MSSLPFSSDSRRSRLSRLPCLFLTFLTLLLFLSPPSSSAAPRLSKGKRISMNFYKAEIRHVLFLFSEIGGLNFVLSDTVKGQVTIKLRNVPWEQALRAILRLHRLGMRYEGEIALIAPLSK